MVGQKETAFAAEQSCEGLKLLLYSSFSQCLPSIVSLHMVYLMKAQLEVTASDFIDTIRHHIRGSGEMGGLS